MYRSLLVPLDGSPFAEHALPLALAVARRSGAALHLVSVVAPVAEAFTEVVYFAPSELQDHLRQQQQAYLARTAERLRGLAEVTVDTQVLEGDVSSLLARHAEQSGADLVVMATHGRGAFGRFWLGSVADYLLRHLTLPLLLTRPEESAADLDTEPNLGHVLLPLDGSELAEKAIGPAVEMAALLPGAEVVLLRVIHPTVSVYYPPEGAAADHEARALLQQVQAMQERLYAEAEAYLGGVAERLRQRGLRVRIRVTVEDHAAPAILHEAKTQGAGLIALATHGRRGLARLVLGSVADKVIRASHGPVLVLRPGR
jgi:nucleotide-binding universal stress UspA family protein